MAPVDVLLRDILPHLSAEARALLGALARCGGKLTAAALLAAQAGLRNRHQLARRLRGDGLPTLEELAGWVSVIGWVAAWESEGASLFRSAVDTGREPATCYRTVKRITGLSWRAVCEQGLPWVLLRFRERCAIPAAAAEGAARGRYGLHGLNPGDRPGVTVIQAASGTR